ncbi:MAG: GspMb/PilO family protein, partial [bacterium]
MKLPENRKERIQVFALIGIGAALALYALFQLLVVPYTAERQKLNAVQGDLDRRMETARKELLYAPAVKEEYAAVTADIDRIMASNVLRPILGSYTVVVTETIEAAARVAGIEVTEIQEVGTRELPRSKTSTKAVEAFKSYAVQVSGEGSYEQVRAFLDKIEIDNPFLCVTEIRITG